ncbi:MAG: hypothetical protein LBJ00_14240, partial [Planctomycetaceae bacterium]|nr:hypothetical protein [Planctomycetaceae bacterium]
MIRIVLYTGFGILSESNSLLCKAVMFMEFRTIEQKIKIGGITMLRKLMIAMLLSFSMFVNFSYAQTTQTTPATVTVEPTEKTCAIGTTPKFNVTGTYLSNNSLIKENEVPQCQWKYVSAAVYSDQACTGTDSTVASVTSSSDTEWANQNSYTKEVSISALSAGECWLKFTMNYRLGDTGESKAVTSEPVKVTVKNIDIIAPTWLKVGNEGQIEITYDSVAFNSGTITLSGLSDLYEILDSDFVEGNASAPTTPQNGSLSWQLAGRTESKEGKIIVKVKGKTAKETTLKAEHSGSSAKAEVVAGVFEIDIILGGIGEDNEENIGAFFSVQKRASLVMKFEPKSAGGNVALSLSDLKLYDEETDGVENTARSWDVATTTFPMTKYVGGSSSGSMRDKEAKLTWKSEKDTAKATVVSVKVEVGSSDEEKNDQKAYLRYYSSLPAPQPDKSKTTIAFTYSPSDLNVGKLKPTVDSSLKLLKSNNNAITLAAEWDLTTATGRDASKSFTGVAQSVPVGEIKVSLKHENTGAEAEGSIYVYQLDLAANTKVFDPKLSGTATLDSTIKYPDSVTPNIAVVDDTNTIVKSLTKDSPNWNGKNNNDEFADPKKYTIKAKLYKDVEKSKEIDSDSADIYVARLGIEKIEFESHNGTYVPMQFHTTAANI